MTLTRLELHIQAEGEVAPDLSDFFNLNKIPYLNNKHFILNTFIRMHYHYPAFHSCVWQLPKSVE